MTVTGRAGSRENQPYRVKIRTGGVVRRGHPGERVPAGVILGAVTRRTSSERTASSGA